MPDYSFSFDPAASGLDYTIKNRAGETVESGTLDESEDVAKVTSTLPWGTYDAVASVAAAPYTSTPAYFAKGEQLANTPGASETAYFVGTATTDTSNDPVDITFTQDPDHTTVDWASASGTDITVLGPVIIQGVERQGGNIDCTDATGFSTTTSGPYSGVVFSFVADGGSSAPFGGRDFEVPTGATGTVFDVDRAAPLGATVGGTLGVGPVTATEQVVISATADSGAYDAAGDPVTDGVGNVRVVVALTRRSLPDRPPA